MRRAWLRALAVGSAACAAHGFEFRCRFVERVGSTDTVITGNALVSEPGAPHRIRIQFGVFDDEVGPAPAAGFIGWNVGTIVVSGDAANSQDRRTPGRFAPFNQLEGGPNGN